MWLKPFAYQSTELLKKVETGRNIEYRDYTDKKLCFITCLKQYIAEWNVAVELDSRQLINNTKVGQKLFDDNTIIDFCPQKCWNESTSKGERNQY